LSATSLSSLPTAHQPLFTLSASPSHYPPNSFRLNLFADPYPLNPVVSIFYKNIGGRGRRRIMLTSHSSPQCTRRLRHGPSSASVSVNSVLSAASVLTPFLSFDVQLSTVNFQPPHPLSPFLATLPQIVAITPFPATHPKSPSRKPFVCHTSETPRGVGGVLLTRHPIKGVCPERPSGERNLSLNPPEISILPAPRPFVVAT